MSTNNKTPKLGRGLDAIFGGDVNALLDDIEQSTPPSNYIKVKIDSLRANPYQPRKYFDDEAIQELAASIKEHGVFTPILIKESVHGYDIISGERRVRASRLAGLKEIDAVVVDFTDSQMMEVALLENIQRENLNAIEEAQAYKDIMEKLNLTQEALGERLGKSRAHIANMIRLLQLPSVVRQYVLDGALSMGHIRPLVTLEESVAIKIASRAVEEKLSVRAVENIVKGLELSAQKSNKIKTKNEEYSYAESLLRNHYGTRVKISEDTIQIKYTSVDDFNRIMELMGIAEED